VENRPIYSQDYYNTENVYILLGRFVLRTRVNNGRFFCLEMKENLPDTKFVARNCYITLEENGTR
jgi:hypothetical protein